jgi:hypothetical protein
VKKISWGKNYRKGLEIVEGVATSLEEADAIEVMVEGEKKKDGEIDVAYTTGEEPQVYHIWVKDTVLVEDVRKTIALAHKGNPITKLASEGAEIADEDSYKDWMFTTEGHPGKSKQS